MIRFVARTYPPCWVLKARIQKHRGKPLLFHDKCPGFFYVHYTTHGTYSFTSHPKDEAIMVKCLAQGHKCCDRPGRDSNSHSGNTRTWVQCSATTLHYGIKSDRDPISQNVTWLNVSITMELPNGYFWITIDVHSMGRYMYINIIVITRGQFHRAAYQNNLLSGFLWLPAKLS